MTKRHFERFAAMFRLQMDFCNDDTLAVILETIDTTANIFADANPRFDRARFLEASGATGYLT
jgi:hypothetical protein